MMRPSPAARGPRRPLARPVSPAASLFLPLLLAAPLPAQGTYTVGYRDVSFPNSTGQGSSSIAARVHYPAAAAGANAPVLPRPGGWPAVVYLHGFAALGSFYGTLGDALAAAGYVAVLHDTAQFDNALQERDGRALYSALAAANAAPGGPFAKALDLARVGLAGHSMGGGNAGNVLAANPGYRCGLALAPVTPRAGNAALVAVPFGILVGTGDGITPWQSNAQPFYQGLAGCRGLKFLYLLNGDCNHTNVAGLFLSGGAATAVFQRVLETTVGFFDRYLWDDPGGLEEVAGAAARAEPRLVSLALEVETPEAWPAGSIRVGATTRLSVAAEPGGCGMLLAAGPAAVPTPFGELRLDPATLLLLFAGTAGAERRVDGSLAVPNDPALVGVAVFAQAFGAAKGAAVKLGAAAGLRVGA